MGLIRGLGAPFRGAAFVAKHGLWGYVAMPIVANAAIALLSAVVAYWLVSRWGSDHAGVWWKMGTLFLSLVLTVPVFLVFYPVVASPFVDLLTEKTEKIVAGGHPSAGFWVGATQAVLHGAAKSALYLFALTLTVLLSAVSGPGALLGLLLGSVFLAFDGFDFPLARRRVGFFGKWRYLWARPAQTAGYCVAASLVFAVPLAFVVAPPFLAVGATLAYLDERR